MSNTTVTVTLDRSKRDDAALIAALQKAGFGGKVVTQERAPAEAPPDDRRPAKVEAGAKPLAARTLILHVAGMKKSRGGAT